MRDATRPLNTSWWVPIRVMATGGLIMSGMVALMASEGEAVAMGSVMLAMWLSCSVFYARRWSALRYDLASGAYTEADFHLEPYRRLIGPKKVAAWWFCSTLFVMLALTFASALHWWPFT